ncbi:MAG: adenylate/guanylate cyclase domain-containing protein, partial [Nitriliruptorales bacterium]|nr:adenylate/guanylate cyclase domain-containing protein [Nitriliruptorales bacterium]
MTCPTCGTDNREGARFCDNCGTRLDGEAAGAVTTPPSPPSVSAPPPEERRIVTALFCDLVGSTAAAETMDPEDWLEVMNGAFERMTEPVDRFGGTVARLMGDAILALFGAPVAHEDDPERAIRAGLAIVEEMGPYAEKIHDELGLEIGVRVGINTGLAMVGQVGSDEHGEYTAMGDTINVAARMEQTAEPGTVQVAEATWRAARGSFTWKGLGGVSVKGKTEPVPTWRPTAAADMLPRARDDVPFIGRDAELRQLAQRLEAGVAGAATLTVLRGEPGVGKTRLVDEAQRVVTGADWLRVTAASWETESAFAFLRRLASGVSAAAPAGAIEGLAPEFRRPLERLLATVLADPDETFQAMVGRALGELITVQAGIILVAEDLHWADEPSVVALRDTIEHVTSNVAFVITSRVDAPTWVDDVIDASTDAVEQRLGVLSPDAVEALLAEAAPDLAEAAIAGAAGRAGGNPLFALELAEAVRSGADHEDLPDNLLSLMIARADKLPPDTRSLAGIAAALGPAFPRALLDAAAPGAAAELVAQDVLVESTDELAFRHALLQEAIYATVPRRDRPALHVQVAERIESAWEHPDELADLLADQYGRAEDHRAGHYEIVAGARAQSLGAAEQAIALLERAQARAVEHADLVDAGDQALLATSLGRAYEMASRYEDAEQVYTAALSQIEPADNELGVLRVMTNLASMLVLSIHTASDADRGVALAREALERAEQLDATSLQARLCWVLSRAMTVAGDYAAARELSERGLRLAEAAADEETLAYLRHDAYFHLTGLGDIEESYRLLGLARTDWERLGVRNMLADALMTTGSLDRSQGRIRSARQHYVEAREVAREIGNTWVETVANFNDLQATVYQGNWADWYALVEPAL